MTGDAAPAIRQAAAHRCQLGESPFWHPQQNCLYWCDIAGHRLHRLDPQTDRLDQWDFACDLASCAPIPGGDLLLAMRDGLWRFDPVSAKRSFLAAPPYDTGVERFNDGKCDAAGRFWVGTIFEPRQPALAALYCFDRGQLVRRADAVTVANGLAWSPDGRTMYWSDTRAHRIDAFDIDMHSGALSRRRPFACFELRDADRPLSEYRGRPDGAAVDCDGCYWVAMFEGARLLQLSPAGECLREIRLPVQCPTMVCFGDADLKTLYVTTASAGRTAEELAAQPWAGCVLRLRVDVPGLPVNFLATP